jgi:hypothetical protein
MSRTWLLYTYEQLGLSAKRNKGDVWSIPRRPAPQFTSHSPSHCIKQWCKCSLLLGLTRICREFNEKFSFARFRFSTLFSVYFSYCLTFFFCPVHTSFPCTYLIFSAFCFVYFFLLFQYFHSRPRINHTKGAVSKKIRILRDPLQWLSVHWTHVQVQGLLDTAHLVPCRYSYTVMAKRSTACRFVTMVY